MSPSLFSKRLEPLKGSYSLCSCNSLEDISGYLLKDYDGFNVTMPYKSSIMNLLDVLDPEAEAIGAVNTLLRCREGWKGFNTDIKGIEDTLSPHIPTKGLVAIFGTRCLSIFFTGNIGAPRRNTP